MPTVPEDHRHMPLNCDGCEASAISGLLAVTMYELLPDSSRIGKVRPLLPEHLPKQRLDEPLAPS